MEQGEVVWYDPALGVGLIQQRDGPDLWVFAESLVDPRRPLRPREPVRFRVVWGPWGPQAAGVRSMVEGETLAAERSPSP